MRNGPAGCIQIILGFRVTRRLHEAVNASKLSGNVLGPNLIRAMKSIIPLLLICLSLNAFGQPEGVEKPLTYEETKARNRPPTKKSGEALAGWTKVLALSRTMQILDGATDAQIIRDRAIQSAESDEKRLRTAFKEAGWTPQQVDTAVSDLKEVFLKLSDIADEIAQLKGGREQTR